MDNKENVQNEQNQENVVTPVQNENVVNNTTPVQNQKKGNNTLAIVLIVVLILLIFIGACIFIVFKTIVPKLTEIKNDLPDTSIKSTDNDKKESNKKDNVSSKDAKESSLESPLEIGKWGFASKYAGKYLSEEYADKTYIDVPVRVTKVTRGEKALSEVKKWAEEKNYKYEEPKAYLEWAVVEYQVDLSNVKFDEGTIGTSIKIDSSLKGIDGGSVKYNDITYILSTRDASSSDYVKEPGVYDGKFITQLPEGCTDYFIVLGSKYNGAEAYFKGE